MRIICQCYFSFLKFIKYINIRLFIVFIKII
nr:MAG TPA: hypothetical protein [Caudoviricetes sp.]